MGKIETRGNGSRPPEITSGVWYIGGIPHEMTLTELAKHGITILQLELRVEAQAARQNRLPTDDLRNPLKTFIKVSCINQKCSNQGVVYQTADLSPLVRRRLNGNKNEPIAGPCVVCSQHTTKIITNSDY